MKKILILLMIAAMTFTGCSQNSFTGVRENGTIEEKDDCIYLSHTLMDGSYSKVLTLKKGDYKLAMNAKSDKGIITVKVSDSNGEEVFKFDNPEKEEKTIHLDKDAQYKVEVIAKEHEGSLQIYLKK